MNELVLNRSFKKAGYLNDDNAMTIQEKIKFTLENLKTSTLTVCFSIKILE